ncbi:type II toxin-antitoxin system VapC family toxin [Granulicella arctica]|uniref:Putative nucleic acid-binding protein n=1 Tax=Granulicella arctica TaxID=940613 RepID=A0A7Y9TFD6_9BACT|nr:type II toxin-antitoxin system VapC family toxin [Granulicella arctica]NYF78234.1 putative nucleic acid-binding protein [Granulicella arctica]
MVLLLDTTVLVDVLRDRNDRRSLLANLVDGGHTLATSAINIGEIYAEMRPEEETETEAFLSSLHCYPITISIARLAGSHKRLQATKGKTLGLVDMLIAATVIEHKLTLMTDNIKDFPLADLALYPLS